MTTSANTTEPAELDHDPHMPKHLRRNYLAHGMEGGIYIGGLAFLSGSVVLPEMVKSLGGGNWLIAATPLVLMIGFQLPALLTVHLIERLERIRPLLLTLGIFQRLPYLLAAAALLFWADDWPTLALTIVMLCPFVSGFIGGLGNTGWQEFVANCIPPHRRSSLWAMRNIISSVIGLVAGGSVYAILAAWPGSRGYALLHLITFGFLVVSYIVFLFIREAPNPRPRPTHTIGLIGSLAQMPGLIAADPQLRRYILCIMFGSGIGIMVPRLSLHVLAVLDRPKAYVGILLIVQTAGAICGNLLAGFLGDRRGGKVVIATALVDLIAVCIWVMFARTAWEFGCIFFGLGAGAFCYHVGRGTLNLEVVPLNQRVRCLAIISACSMVSMLATWLISWQTWEISGGNIRWLAIGATAALVAALVFVLRVKEPRHNGEVAAAATRNTNR